MQVYVVEALLADQLVVLVVAIELECERPVQAISIVFHFRHVQSLLVCQLDLVLLLFSNLGDLIELVSLESKFSWIKLPTEGVIDRNSTAFSTPHSVIALPKGLVRGVNRYRSTHMWIILVYHLHWYHVIVDILRD